MNNKYFTRCNILCLAAIFVSLTLCFQSCNKQEKNTDEDYHFPVEKEKRIDLPKGLTPETIVLEMREGHSHLAPGTEPELGELYWSLDQGHKGFHANPYYDETQTPFPFRTYQKMVLKRQSDGTYAIDEKAGVNVFRVQSSPLKGGVWNALLVQFYDKNNKRIDLDFRDDKLNKRAQIFYSVMNPKPIDTDAHLPGVGENELKVNIDDLKDYVSDDGTIDALKKEYGEYIPIHYTTNIHPYSEEDKLKSDSIFDYYYYDRPTDDIEHSPIVANPIGFRGTFANRIPFVSYDVQMMLTLLPEGSVKSNSRQPSKEQMENVVFKINIPFRTIMEKMESKNAHFDKKAEDMISKKSKYAIEDFFWDHKALKTAIGITVNIKREYPQLNYTIKELNEMYEKMLRDSSPESSNFWL